MRQIVTPRPSAFKRHGGFRAEFRERLPLDRVSLLLVAVALLMLLPVVRDLALRWLS